MTEDAVPAPAPAPDPEKSTKTSAYTLLEQIAAIPDLECVVIGYIHKNGGAKVRWSMPAQPAALAHLEKMFSVRLGRVYSQIMFDQTPASPTHAAAPVRGGQVPHIPREQRRLIQKAQRKADKKTRRQTPRG